jgi:hypothetical protein
MYNINVANIIILSSHSIFLVLICLHKCDLLLLYPLYECTWGIQWLSRCYAATFLSSLFILKFSTGVGIGKKIAWKEFGEIDIQDGARGSFSMKYGKFAF